MKEKQQQDQKRKKDVQANEEIQAEILESKGEDMKTRTTDEKAIFP